MDLRYSFAPSGDTALRVPLGSCITTQFSMSILYLAFRISLSGWQTKWQLEQMYFILDPGIRHIKNPPSNLGLSRYGLCCSWYSCNEILIFFGDFKSCRRSGGPISGGIQTRKSPAYEKTATIALSFSIAKFLPSRVTVTFSTESTYPEEHTGKAKFTFVTIVFFFWQGVCWDKSCTVTT